MARQIIRLTESDLHRIIKESVRRIINEGDNEYGDWRDLLVRASNGEYDLYDKATKAAIEAYGGDKKAAQNAINRFYDERDERRELRMPPKDLAWEKKWEKRYNAEHGIGPDVYNYDDDSEDAEEEGLKRKRAIMKKNAKKKEEPEKNKFSGKSPEELERIARELGVAL